MSPGPLWLVVPDGIDDPARVSGGNVFDRRVRDELVARGWDVRTLAVAPDAEADALSHVPDGGLVLLDGLLAIASPAAAVAEAGRLRIVGLAHMSVGAFPRASEVEIDAESYALRVFERVIVPSAWLRDDLVGRGVTRSERVIVAEPGADEASVARGSGTGGALLCVGAVTEHKGHDTLVEALAGLASDAGWSCTFAGSAETEPVFVARIASRAQESGVGDRITWTGVLDQAELAAVYDRTDLVIAPSRTESYGIAVGDALRRGIPVVASRVGGLTEAVRPPDAGMLVPPGDPVALETALRRWLADPGLREAMTRAARESAPSRTRWSDTAATIDRALRGLP